MFNSLYNNNNMNVVKKKLKKLTQSNIEIIRMRKRTRKAMKTCLKADSRSLAVMSPLFANAS
jgi:hypothetical protein